MKNIYILFTVIIFLTFTACSNASEAANTNADSKNMKTDDSSRAVVKKFYTLISQNRIKDTKDTESISSYFNSTFQKASEFFSVNARLYKYFKNPDYKVTSIEPCQVEQPENIKNQSSYIFDAFKVEYLINFEDNKDFYFNDGINTDYVYLLKEKDNSSSNWQIWRIVNERNQAASEACEQLYREPNSDPNSFLHLEKTSPYYKKNIEHYKNIIDTIDYDSIYVSPFPHPFRTDASGYETISIVVSYDIKNKNNELQSSDNKHNTDYVHLVRNEGMKTCDWKVWRVERRVNKTAEEQIRYFFNLINNDDQNNAYSIISTLAAENDSEYMRNWINNLKAVKIDEILVWEGPPGGDHYIDGYTFYHFRVDGVFTFDKKDSIGADSETEKYLYMIKKDNENRWYVYAISNSP